MRQMYGLSGAFLLLSFWIVDAKIDVFDRYGHVVDSFDDRQTFFDGYFTSTEGFIEAAKPIDACTEIDPPSFLTNFTLGKFVLINGTDQCQMMTKVKAADKAGYDVAVIFDSTVMSRSLYKVALRPYYLKVQVVVVSYEDGVIILNNYLYSHSTDKNFVLRISSDLPDITYYMYLFGGVISVCFFVMLIFLICLLVKCIQERRKNRRNRLSRRQIKKIPTVKFSKGDQYDVCAICLENYNEGDKLRILPCSHAYHAKCIDPWLMHNRRNCPLCKRKVRFGDSGDESDSEDSELTSPAENTPLLSPHITSSARSNMWGTFGGPTSNDGSGPSSYPGTHSNYGSSSVPESFRNPFLSSDTSENLMPPPHLSVNCVSQSPPNSLEQEITVVINRSEDASSDDCQRLIV